MAQAPEINPSETKDAILSAAVELFAASGMNGASIADIAKRAGVTKSLVMYHFPTKEDLWRQSVEFRIGPTMEIVEQFMQGQGEIGLEDLMKVRALAHHEIPEISRMYAWTTLGHGNPIPEDKCDIVKALFAKVAADPQKYKIPEGLDPVMYIGVLMATVDGWFLFREVHSQFAERPSDSKEATEEFIKIIKTIFFSSSGSPKARTDEAK